MNLETDNFRNKSLTFKLTGKEGFSLVELMVVLVLTTAVIAGVTGSFRNFTRHSGMTNRENEKNAAIKSALKLLQRDLNMAGFGLVTETRVAKDHQFENAIESDFNTNYDCDGNSSTATGNITESCLNYDLNGDGDTADNMYRDRLFIANGWEILKDITDNNATDGNIVRAPDYYYKVVNKNENGGYAAILSNDCNAGATSITIDNTNINLNDEASVNNDFNTKGALIIYGKNGAGTYSLEGHLIGTIGGTTALNLSPGDSFAGSYISADPTAPDYRTKIVPAVTWYVEQKAGAVPADSIPWLYRNDDKVLPGVIGFQISFGYDAKNDGLQWDEQVPPTINIDGTAATVPAKLKALRVARIVITTMTTDNDNSTTPVMKTYEKVVLLKN